MSPLAILLILFVAVALLAPMIPMRRRKQKGFAGFPVVTASLIFINVLVFADTVTGDGDLNRYVALHFGMIPRSPNLLTLFTHMFLHGSFMHLFGNMLWLWLFGPHVEEALGRLEYLGFYLGGGIAAGLLHLVIADTLMPAAAVVPLVGASGAISAIMGIFAVRFWRAKVRVLLLFRIPAVVAVGLFGVWQIAEGFMLLADGGRANHTANWAHIGGFVFGALLAVPLRMREDSQLEYGLEDAETAAKDGQLDQSASHYRTVLAATPDDAAAHHALARVLAQMRQGESAHRHYMEALRLFIRKSDLFNTARVYEDALLAFESFPLPPALLQRVASACETVHQYPLAVRALSELCREHAASREAEVGLLRLGKIHLQKLNQPQNAQAIFSEFVRLYPQSEWTNHAHKLQTEAQAAIAAYGLLSAAPPRPNPY